MRKMRIVQFGFGVPGSGGPINALNRLVSHKRYSDEVESLTIVQDFELGGIRPDVIMRWARIVRRYSPDLVHCRGLGNEGLHSVLAARLAGAPNVLLSVHGTQRDLSGPMGVRRRAVVSAVEPLSLRLATQVAGVSRWGLRREFLDSHRHKIVGYVPNGCSPARLEAPQDELRASLGIALDSFVLVNVGRLSWEKGHQTLISALSQIDHSNLVLLVVGDGPDSDAIRAAYDGLNRVDIRFLGQRQDVLRILQLSDLMIFPSLHENSPNVVIEALSQNLPVLATDIPANSEILKDGSGILFPAGDHLELAAHLERCLCTPELLDDLRERGGRRYRETYTLDAMVSGWLDIYRGAIGGSYG